MWIELFSTSQALEVELGQGILFGVHRFEIPELSAVPSTPRTCLGGVELVLLFVGRGDGVLVTL